MANVVAWVVAHWSQIAAAISAALVLASVITAFTPTPKDDEVVRKIASWLSFLQPRTSAGTLKFPGTAAAPEVPSAPSAPFGAVEAVEPPGSESSAGPRRLDRR